MEEGGAASQISQNEERFFDRLCFVPGEEEIIQKETEPMDERTDGPDQIEQQEKGNSFPCQMGGSIFGGEKRTIGRAPEEVKVIVHLDQVPYLSCTSEAVLWTSEARREAAVCIKKALSGFRYCYSIRIFRLGLRAGAR